MSEQGAKAFKERMGSDQAFRAGILGEAHGEGRARMAHAAGFDCTAAEIMSVAGLSDDQLDGVAGGYAAPMQDLHSNTAVIGTHVL